MNNICKKPKIILSYQVDGKNAEFNGGHGR